MFLTAQILSPRAPCLLQRALWFSVLSNFPFPIPKQQCTFPLFFEWSNFLRTFKLFSQSPFCSSKLRNSNFSTDFSPPTFFSLFLVSSSHTLTSPHWLCQSHLESDRPFHLLLPLCSSLTTLGSPCDPHTGVPEDCLSRILYATFVVSYLGERQGGWETGKVSTGV